MIRARSWLLVPLTVVVAAVGLIWGGRSTYVSVRNMSPLTISCADYLASPPDAEWLQLEDCDADLSHASVETTRRGAVETTIAVYIPLRPQGTSAAEPATLLLRVDRGPLMRDRPSEEEIQADFDRPLQGLAELAVDRSAKSKARLRELNYKLAPEFVVITRDAEPRPLWLSLLILGIGLGATALLVRSYARLKRRRPAPLAKAVVIRESD